MTAMTAQVSDRRFAELLERFGGRLLVRLVCAWCKAVLLDDPRQPDLPTSHGACAACMDPRQHVYEPWTVPDCCNRCGQPEKEHV